MPRRRPRCLARGERRRDLARPGSSRTTRATVGWTVDLATGRSATRAVPSQRPIARDPGRRPRRGRSDRAAIASDRVAQRRSVDRRGSGPITSSWTGPCGGRWLDLHAAAQRRPGRRASSTSPPGSRGSRRCSGATASSPRSRRSRSSRRSRWRPSTVLARLQATTDDPWHDAEPGKILHEMRTGEMARAGETPHDAYYGSVDSTPLWLILLGETHAWTGDDALVDRLWPNALAALAWIDDVTATSTATASSNTSDARGSGCSTRAGRTRATPSGTSTAGLAEAPDRPRRGPGLRLRRPARDGPAGPSSRRRPSWQRVSTPRPTTLRARVRRRVLARRTSGFYAMALDGDKRPGREHRLERRARRSGPASSRRNAPSGSRSGCSSPTCSPAGGSGPTPPASPATTRSATTPGPIWPHDNALIAAGFKASRRAGRREHSSPAG